MSATNGQPAARDEYRQARYERMLRQERIRSARLARVEKQEERRRQLVEALSIDWVTPYLELTDLTRRTGDPVFAGPTSAWHRRAGRNWPIYQTEAELNLLRAPARLLLATNSYAQGLSGGITSYLVGTGCTFRIAKADEWDNKLPQAVVDAAQDVVDKTLERNQWYGGEEPGLEEELVERSMEDGEFLLPHYPREDGWTEFRTAEPEMLTQPPGSDWAEYGFGILTPRDDVQKHLKYYLQFGDSPDQGEEYGPDEITHFRRNVRRSMKRGVTDFCFGAYDALYLAGRLATNLSDAAAQQAAIVGVREHETGTQSDIESFNDAQAEFTETVPLTGEQRNVTFRRRGDWEDVPKGLKYVPGPIAQSQPIHIQVLQACLRGGGMRWNAPEWLASGLHDTSSFASSLTAESPFVKTITRRQRGYCEAFRRPVWFAFAHYVRTRGLRDRTGRVWQLEELENRLKLVVTAPNPQTRNKFEEAQIAAIEIPLRVQSRHGYMTEQGRKPDQIDSDNQTDADKFGMDGQQLPLPGEGGGGSRVGNPGLTQDADPVPPAGANSLLGTVGGAGQIADLQKQYAGGSLTREMAVNNAMIIFGIDQAAADRLFPAHEEGVKDDKPPRVESLLESLTEATYRHLSEEGREGLVQKDIQVTRDGKTFTEKRWVRPAEKGGGGSGSRAGTSDHPPAEHVTAGLAEKVAAADPEAAKSPGFLAKVKDLAVTAAAKAYMTLVKATPAMLKVMDVAGAVLDTPQDLKRLGYDPTMAGGQAHAAPAVDAVRNATGISTHLATTIASHVLAKAITFVKAKLAGGKHESVEGDPISGAAAVLAEALEVLAAEFGLPKPDGKAIEAALRKLMGGK